MILRLEHIFMEWSRLLDYIFYLLTVLAACFLTPDYNLLLKMITIDSLFSAVYYLKIYINRGITESQIIDKSDSLYEGSLFDRYIYYVFQYLLYIITCILFWRRNITILYYSILMTLFPSITNMMLNSRIYEIIRKKKENLVKLVIAKQFASLITLVSKTYLNRDISVKHKELLPLLNNYRSTVNYFSEVLKNALVIMLLTYLKNYSPNFYYRVTKYFYSYKTGETLVSFNAGSARQTLLLMIENKDWDELLKPNIYRAIFHLYELNNEKTNYLEQFVTIFKQKLVKMFTIWTISSFFNNIYIAPILSLLMLLYRLDDICNINIKLNIMSKLSTQLIILMSGSLIGYNFPDYFMIVSIICQFGHCLIFNKIVASIIQFIIKKTTKNIKYIHSSNRRILVPLVANIFYMFLYGSIVNIYTTIIMVSHLIYDKIVNKNNRNILISTILFFIGYLSNYNFIHLLFIGIIIYFGLASAFITKRLIKKIKNEMDYKINKLFVSSKTIIIEKYHGLFSHSFKDNSDNLITQTESITSSEMDLLFDLPVEKFIDAISIEPIEPGIDSSIIKNFDKDYIDSIELKHSSIVVNGKSLEESNIEFDFNYHD